MGKRRVCGGMAALLGSLLLPVGPIPSAVAAEPAPLAIDFEAALARALRTSEQLEVAQGAVEQAEGQRQRARAEWLPQVNLSASYDRTLASEFEGLFEPAADEQAPGAPDGQAFEELPFGRENTYRVDAQVAQNLFTGGRASARWDFARQSRRSALLGVGITRTEVVLETARRYLDAALADQLVAIAQATLALAEDTLAAAQAARDAGTQPEFEVIRAEVAVGNQRPAVLNSETQRQLALLELRQILNVEPHRPLRLETRLDADPATFDALARTAAELPVEPVAEWLPVRQARVAVAAEEAGLAIARSQRWPSLSAGMQYGRVAYPEDLGPDWGDFRTNWSVGLVLSWGVFTGGRTRGDITVARGAVTQARARLALTEELARLARETASTALANARAVYEARVGTAALAKRAFELAELRYREGVSTELEVRDARVSLQNAEVSRATAARDVRVASLLVALLPALPLELILATPGQALAGAPALTVGTAGELVQTTVSDASSTGTSAIGSRLRATAPAFSNPRRTDGAPQGVAAPVPGR